MNADVTIANGGTLTITSNDVAILQNRRFVVQPGGTLNIQDAWLHACTVSPCNGMWYGIEIQGGATTSGTVNINNFSVIEDAQNAIITQASVITRPKFFINGAVFNKNTVDIRTQ
jgi:hypothetical protein